MGSAFPASCVSYFFACWVKKGPRWEAWREAGDTWAHRFKAIAKIVGGLQGLVTKYLAIDETAQAYRGLVSLRLENDVGTFDDCCIELEEVETSCLLAVAFSLLAVLFSAGVFVHKWGGVYNAFKDKPWGGLGKWVTLAAKQWANVAFIIAVGASIDASESDGGWSWGKGACPDNSDMRKDMRAANAHLKAARWDLIYGVIGEIVLIELTELYEEFQAARKRNATTAPEN